MGGRWLAVLALSGCGRTNFDACGTPDAAGGVTRVQVASPGAATATITQTLGDLLVAGVYLESGTVPSVTDTFGARWSQLALEPNSNCTLTSSVQFWYAFATTTDANTITASHPMAPVLRLFVVEYAGVDAMIPVQDSGGQIAPGMSMQIWNGGPIDLSEPGVALALFINHMFLGTVEADPGWQRLAHDDGFSAILEETTNPGINMPTATSPVLNDCWAAATVAFRAR